MAHYILVINPGSTSTKIGVFEDEKQLFSKTLRHSPDKIAEFAAIADQKSWRKELVMEALKENNFDVTTLSAVSVRGGLLAPLRGGTYATTDKLMADCAAGVSGQHACNLGGLIAREIGDELGIPSFIVDPPVVDELAPLFHVRADSAPFLMITGDREMEMLGRYEENAYMLRVFKLVKHPDATLYELDGYGHNMCDPAYALLLRFVRQHENPQSRR